MKFYYKITYKNETLGVRISDPDYEEAIKWVNNIIKIEIIHESYLTQIELNIIKQIKYVWTNR